MESRTLITSLQTIPPATISKLSRLKTYMGVCSCSKFTIACEMGDSRKVFAFLLKPSYCRIPESDSCHDLSRRVSSSAHRLMMISEQPMEPLGQGKAPYYTNNAIYTRSRSGTCYQAFEVTVLQRRMNSHHVASVISHVVYVADKSGHLSQSKRIYMIHAVTS
jgi:hypothetical protein